MVKVGINGFGAIGRRFHRAAMRRRGIEVVAVNDLAPPATLAHLLKYDSTYGRLDVPVDTTNDGLIVGGRLVRAFQEKDPEAIPWGALGVDVVIESTGRFTEADKASAHLDAGARAVIISAPAEGDDMTIVVGVNDQQYDPARHRIVSNGSCTTNCLAPVAAVLHDRFGIRAGLMTTVHSYTNDQVVLDAPHRDLRRARAAGQNIIPTSTGAAKAIHRVLPELKGKLNGIAMRVPTAGVSIVDLVAELERDTTVERVNAAFDEAARERLAGILEVSREPLVSSDFKGNPASAIVDALQTMQVGPRLFKVVAWYDNEWGYSNRLCDLVERMARRGLPERRPARVSAPATVGD